MSKQNRHDNLVLTLEERLKDSGWKTTTFKEYHNHHGDGEIDLYAVKDNYRAVVEVKCSIRQKNWIYAHDQLARASRNYFRDDKRTFAFVAYYDNRKSDDYHIEWVNPNNPSPIL